MPGYSIINRLKKQSLSNDEIREKLLKQYSKHQVKELFREYYHSKIITYTFLFLISCALFFLFWSDPGFTGNAVRSSDNASFFTALFICAISVLALGTIVGRKLQK